MTQRKRFQEVISKVRSIWLSANPLLPLQNEKSSLDRLVKEWKYILVHLKEHANVTLKNDFEVRMDRLFDICTCKCIIYDCVAFANCDGCDTKAHINCSCPIQRRIPLNELNLMYIQRNKIGVKSEIQIGSVDKKETSRQIKDVKA